MELTKIVGMMSVVTCLDRVLVWVLADSVSAEPKTNVHLGVPSLDPNHDLHRKRVLSRLIPVGKHTVNDPEYLWQMKLGDLALSHRDALIAPVPERKEYGITVVQNTPIDSADILEVRDSACGNAYGVQAVHEVVARVGRALGGSSVSRRFCFGKFAAGAARCP